MVSETTVGMCAPGQGADAVRLDAQRPVVVQQCSLHTTSRGMSTEIFRHPGPLRSMQQQLSE